MAIRNKNTRWFHAFKCMLSCVYYYNKQKNPNYDFAVKDGYLSLTDDDIVNNHRKLFQYLTGEPVVLVVAGGNKSALSNVGKTAVIEHRNGIKTCAVYDSKFLEYYSIADCVPCDEIYAKISELDREEIMRNSSVYRLGFQVLPNMNCIVNQYSESSHSTLYDFYSRHAIVSCAFSDIFGFATSEYLEKEIGVKVTDVPIAEPVLNETESDMTPAVEDKTAVVDVTSERWNNIWEIFKNKGKMADRYQRLIDALSIIDTDIIPKLDSALHEQLVEDINKPKNPFDSAANMMSN